jgi:hypothetical protein
LLGKASRDYLTLKLGTLEREVFAVIFLDKRHRVISYQEMFQGTIDGAAVHPREVVKEALKQNAAAVILAHPHPSGVAEPSQADEFITQRMKERLASSTSASWITSSLPAAIPSALPKRGSSGGLGATPRIVAPSKATASQRRDSASPLVGQARG